MPKNDAYPGGTATLLLVSKNTIATMHPIALASSSRANRPCRCEARRENRGHRPEHGRPDQAECRQRSTFLIVTRIARTSSRP
jgi:hypothetical protein